MPYYYDRKLIRNMLRKKVGNKNLNSAWKRVQGDFNGQAGVKRKVSE